MAPPDFLFDGPEAADDILVLAHGAGAPIESPFMNAFARGLAACGIRIARFEFPYMVRRRRQGGRSPPDRAPVLRETWYGAIAALGGGARLVVGGKSMGGRIASLIADDAGVRGLVCLGYPFHPPGRPEQRRSEHLETIRTPTLIVQGERDALGRRAEVEAYVLSPRIRLAWLPDGDHGFKPRKASGRTEEENWEAGIARVADFIAALP